MPWQLLQVCAIAAPALALPCARFRRVSVVQATVEAGWPAIGGDTRALPFGRPTARQIALHRSRPSAPRWAEGSQTKPTASARKNSPTVAPIHMANRESRGDGWSPLVIRGNLKSGHGRFVEKHKLRDRIAIVCDGQGQHEQRPYPKAVQGLREPARRIDRERKFKRRDGGGWPAM